MIPHDKLLSILQQTVNTHTIRGELTWERSQTWVRTHNPPLPGIRGGGWEGEARPDSQIEDAHLDWLAGQYHAELEALTARLVADLNRLRKIEEVCTPPESKVLGSRDMLAAQAAADGWCRSCFRDDQHLQPITLRPDGKTPYYAGLCKRCGEWRQSHGEEPPMDVLRTRHRGGRVRVRA